nr:MAG TPA: hypothetical protein [Caudoviricetes sp.]
MRWSSHSWLLQLFVRLLCGFTNERSDLRQMSNQMKRIMKKLELRLTAQCI